MCSSIEKVIFKGQFICFDEIFTKKKNCDQLNNNRVILLIRFELTHNPPLLYIRISHIYVFFFF